MMHINHHLRVRLDPLPRRLIQPRRPFSKVVVVCTQVLQVLTLILYYLHALKHTTTQIYV